VWIFTQQKKNLSAKIVFSPLHGSGSKNVLPLLEQQAFDVIVVPEQAKPDSTFPTAHGDLINPEFPEVMAMAVELGEKSGADLVIVSDPDADRIGVAAKDQQTDQTMRLFSGDEIGAMLTHFILSQRQANGTLPQNGVVIETYVTTTLMSDIAKSFGVKVIDDLLVGFKYIAEIIEMLEDKNDFIFAAEQSLGYLAGTFTRDKDAAIGALLVSEMASVLKDDGKTLGPYLNELGDRYGFYKNSLHTLDMEGKEGSERLFQIMTGFRSNAPSDLAGVKVQKVVDRLPEESRAIGKYKVGKTGDQITFILSEDDRTRITVRPSGTEPIIKFYIQYYSKTISNHDEEIEMLRKAITEYSQQFVK
jgi:phosphomannomutase